MNMPIRFFALESYSISFYINFAYSIFLILNKDLFFNPLFLDYIVKKKFIFI